MDNAYIESIMELLKLYKIKHNDLSEPCKINEAYCKKLQTRVNYNVSWVIEDYNDVSGDRYNYFSLAEKEGQKKGKKFILEKPTITIPESLKIFLNFIRKQGKTDYLYDYDSDSNIGTVDFKFTQLYHSTKDECCISTHIAGLQFIKEFDMINPLDWFSFYVDYEIPYETSSSHILINLNSNSKYYEYVCATCTHDGWPSAGLIAKNFNEFIRSLIFNKDFIFKDAEFTDRETDHPICVSPANYYIDKYLDNSLPIIPDDYIPHLVNIMTKKAL